MISWRGLNPWSYSDMGGENCSLQARYLGVRRIAFTSCWCNISEYKHAPLWGWCKNKEHPLYCTSTKNLNESFLATITDHPQERRIVNHGFWRTWWTFKFDGLELWMLKVLEIIHKATQNVIVCIDFISKILKPRLDSGGWQPDRKSVV